MVLFFHEPYLVSPLISGYEEKGVNYSIELVKKLGFERGVNMKERL
jgi:hypothetical protein